jgi:malto-oligosyltrehalose trehalohydrolase
VHLVLENDKNQAHLLERDPGGRPIHYDAQWNDDIHHVYHQLLTGEAGGYYADYAVGAHKRLARALSSGFVYQGDVSDYRQGAMRGEPCAHLPPTAFVSFIQNHDQVGNRACGDRLHHRIDAGSWRAASVLLLTSPGTPLLFMGQEWAASTPFLYFTDLGPDLGRAVSEGRRREFKDFPEFADGEGAWCIPDPQAPSTFEESKLRWEECGAEPHASHLALYRELLHLRETHRGLQATECRTADAWAASEDAIVMCRGNEIERFVIVAQLRGSGVVEYKRCLPRSNRVEVLLTTEDPRFEPDPVPPAITDGVVRFERAGAVLLRSLGQHA